MLVPAGMILKTGYVNFANVTFEQFGGNYLPAVEKYVQRYADSGGGAQDSDCPFGYWRGETFVIQNGRHRLIALLICGYADFLVSWIAPEGS